MRPEELGRSFPDAILADPVPVPDGCTERNRNPRAINDTPPSQARVLLTHISLNVVKVVRPIVELEAVWLLIHVFVRVGIRIAERQLQAC